MLGNDVPSKESSPPRNLYGTTTEEVDDWSQGIQHYCREDKHWFNNTVLQVKY